MLKKKKRKTIPSESICVVSPLLDSTGIHYISKLTAVRLCGCKEAEN